MKILEAEDVRWYAGRSNKTSPREIKVNGVWRKVFAFEKQVFEDFVSRKRRIIFLCHMGDNEFVNIEIPGY